MNARRGFLGRLLGLALALPCAALAWGRADRMPATADEMLGSLFDRYSFKEDLVATIKHYQLKECLLAGSALVIENGFSSKGAVVKEIQRYKEGLLDEVLWRSERWQFVPAVLLRETGWPHWQKDSL